MTALMQSGQIMTDTDSSIKKKKHSFFSPKDVEVSVIVYILLRKVKILPESIFNFSDKRAIASLNPSHTLPWGTFDTYALILKIEPVLTKCVEELSGIAADKRGYSSYMFLITQ